MTANRQGEGPGDEDVVGALERLEQRLARGDFDSVDEPEDEALPRSAALTPPRGTSFAAFASSAIRSGR